METKRGLSFSDLQRIKRGTVAYDIYLFPYTDMEIGIRLLTQEELITSNQEAYKKTSKFATQNTPSMTGYEIREILYRCCIKIPAEGFSEKQERFFETPEQVGILSVDEINKLMTYYDDMQLRYAPETTVNTVEEFNNLIEEIKKKSPHGMSLSTQTLRTLVLFMVNEPINLPKDNGSISTGLKQKSENSITELRKQVGIKIESPNS